MFLPKGKSGSTIDPPILSIGNSQIEFVSEFKLLGVKISNNLCWESHINHIVSKVSSCFAILHRTKFLPCKQRLLIFHAIGLSHILYCSSSYALAPIKVIRPLKLKFNECVRHISSKNKLYQSTAKSLSILELNSFEHQLLLFNLKFLFILLLAQIVQIR